MSKNRKHRKTSPAVSKPDFQKSAVTGQPERFFPGLLLRLAAILGLSCALGFAFNAGNPVGVRFGEPPAATVVAEKKAEIQVVAEVPVTPTNVVAPPPMPQRQTYVATTQPKASTIHQPVPVLSPPAVRPPQSASNAPVITPGAPANPSAIHWPEAKALVAEGKAVLVDVRHKAMYDAGHIPGAISLPEHSSSQQISEFLNSQPTNMTIIVYCSSTSCSQSARVANRYVHEFHRTDVRYMTGGYLEYQQSELAKPAASAP